MSESSYINDTFTSSIGQWLEYDNKIQSLKQQMKQLRTEKSKINEYITNYLESNRLVRTKINLSDGYIKYSKINQSSPLTLKYIQQCLKDYFQDDELALKVCDYIKNNRKTTPITTIKRYIK
tara:strand:- start:210 stop:575 length:366 start_codon:yes stop_codon:yes gene_type:complete